jgi:hypothetical protein
MLAYQPLPGFAEAVVRRFLCGSSARVEQTGGYDQEREAEAAQHRDDGFRRASCWALALANHGTGVWLHRAAKATWLGEL